jgi:hypothetical protein
VAPVSAKKLALTSLTSGGRSIGIVRLRIEAMEFVFCIQLANKMGFQPKKKHRLEHISIQFNAPRTQPMCGSTEQSEEVNVKIDFSLIIQY